MSGLFCTNFSTSLLCWKPCYSVWCGSCYTPHPLDGLPHFIPTEESGFEWHPPEGDSRYLQARDGVHLVTPFHCYLCVFQNVAHINPNPSETRDERLLCCIHHFNLDAMWGREPSMVDSASGQLNSWFSIWQLIKHLEAVGIEPSFPSLGPFPMEDFLALE
jgi:hypothetical protein